MAIAIDIRDCAPRGRGFGRGFEGPGVAAGARPASPERCCAGPQPSRGMPRIQQERRCGRQETERIARNVRALFEWTFPALADATSPGASVTVSWKIGNVQRGEKSLRG